MENSMHRQFKVLSPKIIQLVRTPRDYVFVFNFDEQDNIKEVRVYARTFVHQGVEMGYYSENDKTSTFICLCKLYRWCRGQGEISKLDFNWALTNLKFEYKVSEQPWEKFFSNLKEGLLVKSSA